MNHEELYEYSVKLNSFVTKAKNLKDFHYYRYRYFVENSRFDNPLDCKYVIRTKKFGEDQENILKDWMMDLRDELDKMIEVLGAE